MNRKDGYDIAVIGLGPVGCLAALLLAWRGLRVAAVERDPTVYALPRAAVLDGEIVRALQPTGLADTVAALLQKTRPGERAGFTNSRREWLFGRDTPDFGLNGWQPNNFFLQPELEGLLRDQVLAHPNIDAHVPATVTGFTSERDGVTLRLMPHSVAADGFTDSDANAPGRSPPRLDTRELHARWVIACDGATSTTRRALGVDWRSLGYDHDWLVVDAHVRPGHTLGHDTLQVCDPDRLTTFVGTKDPNRRWEFRLLPGETRAQMLEPARIRSLIETWTPPGSYDVVRAAVYRFHAATVSQWRVGRILLAGDAAHQTPPFLGQGMNTGMRDAVNLSWKLPLVISGMCSERLLDTYQSERQAHAEDLIDWAVSLGRLMEHLADVERATRVGQAPPASPQGLQSSGYGQGRGMPRLKAGVLDQPQADSETGIGHLFAQPIVRDADGRECRLDDLLGSGFALVGTHDGALALSDNNLALLQRLGGRRVSLAGITPIRGRFDRIFRAADAVLVRPDRYIFGHTGPGEHGSGRTADAVLDALAATLHLSSSDKR